MLGLSFMVTEFVVSSSSACLELAELPGKSQLCGEHPQAGTHWGAGRGWRSLQQSQLHVHAVPCVHAVPSSASTGIDVLGGAWPEFSREEKHL